MSQQWEAWRRRVDLDSYDDRWREMEAGGVNPHGEADLVCRLEPRVVLDGGTGTGRVAIELARRGIEVVGVDLDADMVKAARAKAPDLTWVEADLATLELNRQFDVAVLAGNVLLFTSPGTEAAAVMRLANHLVPGGHLVMGLQLLPHRITVDALDRWCHQAGLEPVARYSTWDGQQFVDDSGYLVATHQRRQWEPR